MRNFWKMIYDRKCAVVVMLSDLVERREESSAQYWPSSGSYEYGEYCVELLGEEPLGGFIIRDLCVIDTRVNIVRIKVFNHNINNYMEPLLKDTLLICTNPLDREVY